ncbi:H-NS family nucleoid-associated regulatory protein [Caballeronia novacaledonica]|uniref:H-NS family nucleoid-associated regulatory protein n=1 Tax=Caballeronia novacaledonica TaxID=1544861 RepID=UPI001FE35A86|nr:H-NS family nucleoid-associated regulatory protein [Caballeronia novacaledonica]
MPAKYEDPKSGATWSGRGPAPKWLASAKDRTRFLIKQAAAVQSDESATRKATKSKAAATVGATSKKVGVKKVVASKKVAAGKKAATKTSARRTVATAKKASAPKTTSRKATPTTAGTIPTLEALSIALA